MLFNLQNLFQTEDKEATVAEYEDPHGMKKKKNKNNKNGKQKVADFYRTTVYIKVLDSL